MGVGHGVEEDLAGEPLHLRNRLLEPPAVLNGLAPGLELLWAQRHGTGLAGDFPGPLITGAGAPKRGVVQHLALPSTQGQLLRYGAAVLY